MCVKSGREALKGGGKWLNDDGTAVKGDRNALKGVG